MKTRFLALPISMILTSALATSNIVGSAHNKAGGETFIYDQPCPDNAKGLIVMATSDDGQVKATGCITILNDEQLMLTWSNGQVAILSFDRFTWRTQKREPAAEPQQHKPLRKES